MLSDKYRIHLLYSYAVDTFLSFCSCLIEIKVIKVTTQLPTLYSYILEIKINIGKLEGQNSIVKRSHMIYKRYLSNSGLTVT